MTLMTRMARLFRADLHAVLDRIEEPALVLEQALREMEAELAADEQRLRLLRHEAEQLDARTRELAQALRCCDEELDLCLETEQEALARAVVRRKLEAQRDGALIERRQADLQRAIEALSERIQRNRTRLEAMRRQAALLAAEDGVREAGGGGWAGDAGRRSTSIDEHEIDLMLLRERQRRARS